MALMHFLFLVLACLAHTVTSATFRENPWFDLNSLEDKADVNLESLCRGTALYEAARSGNVKWIRDEVEKGADLEAVDLKGATPLHAAVQNGEVEATKLLLRYRAYHGVNHQTGWTLLHHAALNGTPKLIHELCNCGFDADINAIEYEEGLTPLHIAAREGHWEAIQMLLSHGAEMNAKDDDMWTPLHYAAWNCHLTVVSTLLRHGANANARNTSDCTPLHLAASVKCAKHIDSLGWKRSGQHLNFATWKGQAKRIKTHQLAIVRELLTYGADAGAKDSDGLRPLEHTGLCKSSDVYRKLLGCSTVHSIEYSYEKMPLHKAAQRNDLNHLEMLLQQGFDTEAQDAAGRTPLHIAAIKGHLKAVKVLLRFGADKRALDDCNLTPLHLAGLNGRSRVYLELFKHRVNMNA